MLKNTIPSYLYLQYSDDEDLQAFVASFNKMAQEYVDWFNTYNLPIYTSLQIAGYLLDWVAQGLYGLSRPVIGIVTNKMQGTYATFQYASIVYAPRNKVEPFILNDDFFKRVITWHFYKGDGKVFDVTWLKRRVERFLFGANGSDYLGTTYRVSVIFQSPSVVIINIINRIVTFNSGALFSKFGYGIKAKPYASASYTTEILPPIPNVDILKMAIDSGVLELPFQFQFIVINI